MIYKNLDEYLETVEKYISLRSLTRLVEILSNVNNKTLNLSIV